MSRHTPGPWALRPTRSDDRVTIEAQGADGLSRCVGEIHGAAAPEGYANAALIASAPDLLTACRRALPILEDICSAGPDDEVPARQDVEAYCALRDAIARATGEEP